jgi:hypothetical protein
MPTIRQALTTDWGPSLESAARQIATVLVAVYVAGHWLGSAVHRLNAALSAWASKPHRPANPSPAPASADPVAKPGPVSIKAAALLQAGGLSQREIANILQVSRSTVRRQLQTT